MSSAGECRGNPCNVATGDKITNEVDYTGAGIDFKRGHHSAVNHIGTRMGARWTHSYSSRLINNYPYIGLVRDSGFVETMIHFGSGKYYGSNSDTGTYLHKKASDDWWLFFMDGHIQMYDQDGRLKRVRSKDGLDTVPSYDAEGRLDYVTGPYGHVLDIVYDLNGYIQKIVDPAGNDTEYGYSVAPDSGSTILTSVTYPGSEQRHYLYEMAGQEFDTLITGIVDANGDRYSTYAYNSDGLVSSSEHAGGKEKITLTYTPTSTQVVEVGGSTTNYQFSGNTAAPKKVISRTEAGSTQSTVYPAYYADWMRDRPSEKTDELGNTIRYTYDARDIKTKKIATGTPHEKTITYTHAGGGYIGRYAKISMPSVYASGKREIDTVFDAMYRPTSITVSGHEPDGTPISSTTSFTYDATGKVATIDGPRTGVADVTSFSYYNCSSGYECGQLASITNALGQTTTFDDYDANGRLLEQTDPNGLTVSYGYDLRGRVVSVSQSAIGQVTRATVMTYDDAGQITSVSMPDGMVLTYEYDEAHDLLSVSDNLGNRIEYDYDSRGNRTEEDVLNASSTLSRAVDLTYDLKNRVDTINKGGFTTDLLFDAVGNLTGETDPNAAVTEHSYDVLGRIEETVDALLGVTSYSYDVNNNLVSTTAPNGAVTTYVYDDLGNMLSEQSPDRGTLAYSYDSAGNRIETIDARGMVTTYSYDALNRLTQTTLDNSDIIDFDYDFGTNGVGRLTKVTDPTGFTSWSFDVFGAVIQKTQAIGTTSLVTSYTRNAAGQVVTITLPSGRIVTNGYNSWQHVSLKIDSSLVLAAATYDPFGPVTGWTWGDSSIYQRTFDLRGLVTGHTLGPNSRALGYDPAGQMVSVLDSRHTDAASYDLLGRIDEFSHAGAAPLPGLQEFEYDSNGNRVEFSENGFNWPYSIQANSNRIMTSAGPVAKSYTHDAAGNVTSDGVHNYSYDERGRLVSVDAGSVTYQHNGLGQRVLKDDGSLRLFVYDDAGRLVGEYDNAGNSIQETVWFNNAPVAVLKGANIYYVHTDHLGTPRAITDSGTVVWRWESDPFGVTQAQDDPDGDSVPFTYNLRFPGQYYDQETGFHYNYFRTYDSSTGRYLESDPIGLLAGPNTYAYVGGNPLSGIDPFGLIEFFEFELNSQPSSELQCECGESFTAFSGNAGEARNNPDFASAVDLGPLPPGRYYIVDRPVGGRLGWLRRLFRDDWYALYRDDGAIDDRTTVGDVVRDAFRLHPGGRSAGCVTLGSQDQFARLRELLESTQPQVLPTAEGLVYYGVIDVTVPAPRPSAVE